uniref:Uncharacterized protein n=1 Tax=Aegilops tauschii subsp. strangulata TaxID=200361 RepID=A0A453IUP5_AEGTS
MEYLELVEFSNYGTNCFRAGGGGGEIQSKDPKNLEDISRKGFSTGLSYMYYSLSEVSNGVRPSTIWEKRGKSL